MTGEWRKGIVSRVFIPEEPESFTWRGLVRVRGRKALARYLGKAADRTARVSNDKGLFSVVPVEHLGPPCMGCREKHLLGEALPIECQACSDMRKAEWEG